MDAGHARLAGAPPLTLPRPPATTARILDRYFGNVCELDIIFNFHKAYYILDELLLGGELQESNKREVLRVTAVQDDLTAAEDAVPRGR